MAKKNTEVELWERQEGETNKQFEAFCIYRDLGVDRSHRKVANELGKSTALINRWGSMNDWAERVKAYDDEQDRLNRIAQRKEIAEMRKRHANVASRMIEKALEALEAIDALDVGAGNVSRMVEVATKVERISRGDVSDVIEERVAAEPAAPAVQFYIPNNNRDNSEED